MQNNATLSQFETAIGIQEVPGCVIYRSWVGRGEKPSLARAKSSAIKYGRVEASKRTVYSSIRLHLKKQCEKWEYEIDAGVV